MDFENLRTMRCAIHVHTSFDDGELSAQTVIEHAKQCGVDALLLTDHDHAYSMEKGFCGWHDNTLVIPGIEFASAQGDHVLTFGFHEKLATRRMRTHQMLKVLKEKGATIFAAHPQGRPMKYFFPKRFKWRYWDSPDYDGIEGWSYMHDWIEHLKPWNLPDMCRNPDRHITGPNQSVLHKWDHHVQTRRLPAIAGLDTHGRYLPFGLGHVFTWAKSGILPYDQNFESFANYALCENITGDNEADAKAVIAGLKSGNSWMAHDSLADARDFKFYGTDERGDFLSGIEREFISPVTIKASLPEKCYIELWRRGAVVTTKETDSFEHTVKIPGEYRLSIYLGGKPWIMTNHLYLRSPLHLEGGG